MIKPTTELLFLITLFLCGWLTGASTCHVRPRTPPTDTLTIHDTLTIRDTIEVKKVVPTTKTLDDGQTITCKVTYYQPTAAQCHGNPLKTADGSTINLNLLNANKLRWCAVSSDIWAMLPKNNKRIYISGYIDGYNGWYEVHDKTAARHRRLVDILVPINLKRGTLHTKSNIKVTIGK